jgi:negative regulator of sigma E activity
VIQRIKSRPPSLKARFADWFERYRIGLASPVAPIGVAATVAVAIIAATLIYATNSAPEGTQQRVAPTLAESSTTAPADVATPPSANDGEAALAKSAVRTPRRPRHEERPFKKNESFITYYNAKSGTVVVDADPDGEDPTVVWHFADEGGAVQEENKI